MKKEPRNKILKFRVTEGEKQQVIKLSENEGYREHSDYLRDLALQKKFFAKVPIPREVVLGPESIPIAIKDEAQKNVRPLKKGKRG